MISGSTAEYGHSGTALQDLPVGEEKQDLQHRDLSVTEKTGVHGKRVQAACRPLRIKD